MRTFLRIILIILTLCFGIAAINLEFGRQELGLFDELKQIPFVILCILTILLTIVDYKSFRTTKTFLNFLPTFLAVLFLGVTIYKKIIRNNINNERTVLKVVNQAGAKNVLEFDFKKDNNYVLTEFNLLGRDVYYGKYKRNSDTVYLLTNSYDGKINTMPKFGIISHDTLFWYKFDTMLIEKQD
ncbi:MAG: hypothetical protein JST21_01375 [Bacteroidetes bacterium]|nr:hypothetical protein [Bacteroidota bacterium]